MNTKEVMDNYDKYVMHTYGRQPIVLDHGHGVKVYDKDGNEYLDFFAGIAVNNVGQTNEKVVEAIKNQAEKMIHSSNIYYNEPAAILAEKLANKSHFTKTFFSNSGAEANEAAIKLARKATGKGEIITALQSFHGRTMLTVTATGQDQFSAPFKPLPPGFKHVPYNDLKAMEDAISDDTAAIMLEVVQGEGGVNVANQDYMNGIQKLCDDNNILLIIDEVQTGVGRCGSFFAHDLFGIKPDIVSLAKGLGGGVPIGATLATEEVASAFVPGDHGSTFGGNPLAAAAADAAIDVIDEKNLSQNAKEMGGTQIWLEEGEKISVDDLLKGITMASANDAMVLMAEMVSGTEEAFVKEMNEKAKKLGLKNTNFVNSTGFDEEGGYSSAYDMALIARELIKHEKVLEYTSKYEDYIRENTENKTWIVNTNKVVYK